MVVRATRATLQEPRPTIQRASPRSCVDVHARAAKGSASHTRVHVLWQKVVRASHPRVWG